MQSMNCANREGQRALLAVGVLALALIGLGVAPAHASETLEACAVEPLVAGGGNYGTLAGRVLVDPTGGGSDEFIVTFDTTPATSYYFGTYRGHYDIPGTWYITGYHVDVACLENGDDFPVNNGGNPRVGRFEYSNKKAMWTQQVEVAIEAPYYCADGFYVAAHATVSTCKDCASETAWAVEAPFSWVYGGSSWAQFFLVDTAACATPSAPPVSPPNRKPIANPDSYEVKADMQLTVLSSEGVLKNDSDPDGDSLQVKNPGTFPSYAGGAFSLSFDGSFVYTPKAGFTGTDWFTYEATDGTLYSSPAKASIQVTRNDPVVTPPPPAVATCYQCEGLACLLDAKSTECGPGQDLCFTNVEDRNGVVRTINRGCGSRTDIPAPSVPSDTCKNVEVALLGADTNCRFYCDGVTNTGCNNPPSLIPVNGRVPAW